MDVGAGQRAAAGAAHVVEYLMASEAIPVPRTPRHCRGLLFWRQRMIPVIDLAALLADGATAATATRRAVVLAWQERSREPLQYGALLVTVAPGEIWVSDDMADDLAAAPEAFRHIARTAIQHEGQVVPILDARRLFGQPLPAELLGSGQVRAHVYRFNATTSASDGLVPDHSVAESMPIWQAISQGVDLPESPVVADVPDVAPHRLVTVAEPEAVVSAVVLPFATARLAPPDDIPQPVPEAPVIVDSLAPDEKPILTMEPDAGDFVTPVIVVPVEPVLAPGGTASAKLSRHGTLESYERLRAIEQSTKPMAHDGPSRRDVMIAFVLGVLIVTALVVALFTFGAVQRHSTEATRPVAQDVAPGGIDPHSVPSTPTQPPK